MNNSKVKRTYKDSLFRMIFREKESLLSLYNAVNGSDYQNAEDLEIRVMDDILYMGMKNDVSFLIGSYLNLYEAQSTWNPNMPLRGLFYLSDEYQGYVAERRLDIYGESQLKLPMPKYIVFYNGTKDIGEKKIVRLSDSFIGKDLEEPALECVAIYLNVNYGHNQEIMSQCRKLYEYSFLIDQIRRQLRKGLVLKQAMDKAVEYCIENGVLADFLRRHRAEVSDVILTEYDEKLHMENEKEISYKAGVERGVRGVIKRCRKKNVPDEDIEREIMEIFGLDKDEAKEYMNAGEEYIWPVPSPTIAEYYKQHAESETEIGYEDGRKDGKILARYEDGMQPEEIARKMGLTVEQVEEVLRKNQIPVRA